MNDIRKQDIKNIINREIDWGKLAGTKVLVTGTSGMLGRLTCDVLTGLSEIGIDVNVYGLARDPNKIESDITVIKGDVTNTIETDIDFDYIINMASPASPGIMAKDPAGTLAANAIGAWNTLRLAKKSGVRGYLFLSSREIYGEPDGDTEYFDESTYGYLDPIDPRSCYPEGKRAAETMCSCFRSEYGLNTKVVRLTHTYGPGMSLDDGRVQADFINDAINGHDILMKSDGSKVRSYLYVADAVAGIFDVLLDSPDDEMVYNVADTDSVVTIKSLAEMIANLAPNGAVKVKMEIESCTKGAAPFKKGILCDRKIRGLGWTPEFSLEEGLKRTVAYYAL